PDRSFAGSSRVPRTRSSAMVMSSASGALILRASSVKSLQFHRPCSARQRENAVTIVEVRDGNRTEALAFGRWGGRLGYYGAAHIRCRPLAPAGGRRTRYSWKDDRR